MVLHGSQNQGLIVKHPSRQIEQNRQVKAQNTSWVHKNKCCNLIHGFRVCTTFQLKAVYLVYLPTRETAYASTVFSTDCISSWDQLAIGEVNTSSQSVGSYPIDLLAQTWSKDVHHHFLLLESPLQIFKALSLSYLLWRHDVLHSLGLQVCKSVVSGEVGEPVQCLSTHGFFCLKSFLAVAVESFEELVSDDESKGSLWW